MTPKSRNGDAKRKGGQRSRRAGRSAALQQLYALDQKAFEDDGLLATDDLATLDDEGRNFAAELVAGVLGQRPAIDAVLADRLDNWTLDRVALVDRNLLRLGCYELLYREQTPPKVAINEYIELGKVFGSETATPRLINGVLDRIAKEHLDADEWG